MRMRKQTLWEFLFLWMFCINFSSGGIKIYTNRPPHSLDEIRSFYYGSIALEGENVTIVCTVGEKFELWRTFENITRKVVQTGDGRIIQSRSSSHLNTTITNVTFGDTGNYQCEKVYFRLRVYRDPEDQELPAVVRAECKTYESLGSIPDAKYGVVCSFFTSTLPADFMAWNVSLYKRDGVVCLGGNSISKCRNTCQPLNTRRAKDGTDIVECIIRTSDTSTLNASYLEFKTDARNPFSNSSDRVNCSVTNLKGVVIPEYIQAQFEVPKQSDPSRAMIRMSGEVKWVNYKLYMGYAAATGSNITISLEVDNSRNMPCNSTDPGDPRKKLTTGGKWRNITIEHVSYEDAGPYICNNDRKDLIVIDADKSPTILTQRCESLEFRNLICIFQTNSKKRDMMMWSAQYAFNSNSKICIYNKELCSPVKCEQMETFLEDGVENINCTIVSHLLVQNSEIDFFFTAYNPFINSSLSTQRVKLDTSIVKFEISDVKAVSVVDRQLSVSVLINNEAALGQLFNFRVVYTHKGLSVEKNFENITIDTDLTLTGLSYHTEYQLNISGQLSSTRNHDTWSEAYPFTVFSATSHPVRAPRHSSTGYELKESKACGDKSQLVTLFWEPLSESDRYGNGVITKYSVYELNSIPTTFIRPTTSQKDVYDFSPSSILSRKSINAKTSSNSSATMCVSKKIKYLALVPFTSHGMGTQLSVYQLPSNIIPFRGCEMQVSYDSKHIIVKWPVLPRSTRFTTRTSYTVYWCKPEANRDQCVPGTTNWRVANQQGKLKMTYDSMSAEYRYGLSVSDSSVSSSSGIVWADCISNSSSTRLKPASVNVEYTARKATVTIEDRCSSDTRRAESYTLSYCNYNRSSEKCIDEVKEVQVGRCRRPVDTEELRFSQDYGFWVTSHARKNLSKPSSVVIKQSPARQLKHYELAVICICLLLITFTITLAVLWVRRQKKMVRTLNKPQVIAPTTLINELPTDSESEDDDSGKFYSTETGTDNSCGESMNYAIPSLKESEDATSVSSILETSPSYINNSLYSTSYTKESSAGTSLPDSGYFKVANTQSWDGDYKAPSIVYTEEDCSVTPDGYFKSMWADPESDLLLADVKSGDDVIDIAQLLSSSATFLNDSSTDLMKMTE
ncbi:hypothetical protein EB796_001788 [Bugula neritina]|uniref:Ig-like domain-containing protein n=1 Tax=Bugula neritina TaxID=10212 RepID=A0A7J7KP34_BUGNE|nr:hypothetical protein EB796_001788 [Bugula neritina]